MRLIDADALRKAHCEDCNHEAQEMCKSGPICATLMWVDEAPTIEAEPVKHGRWVEHICFDDGFWICSNCKFVSQATAAPKLYRYCPNCGAKMDEEGET